MVSPFLIFFHFTFRSTEIPLVLFLLCAAFHLPCLTSSAAREIHLLPRIFSIPRLGVGIESPPRWVFDFFPLASTYVDPCSRISPDLPLLKGTLPLRCLAWDFAIVTCVASVGVHTLTFPFFLPPCPPATPPRAPGPHFLIHRRLAQRHCFDSPG